MKTQIIIALAFAAASMLPLFCIGKVAFAIGGVGIMFALLMLIRKVSETYFFTQLPGFLFQALVTVAVPALIANFIF